MLQVHNLHKSYGISTVLANISFVVNGGEHVGLVSPNGIGKSTLLRCIVGQEAPDAGSSMRAPPDATLGYMPQAFADAGDQTVGEVVAAAQAAWHAAADAVQHAADALADTADMDAALAAYDAALAHFEALGGYEREARAAAVLGGLALGDVAASTPVATLSGGQKTRLGLATLLLREPDLLLLDEPTNHLDVAALEWLEGFVQRYGGAALIVSHDRAFLDATATRILYLDPATRAITSYAGNYSAFAAARAHERELHAATWQKQQEYVGKVSSDIARLKGQALGVETASTPKNSDAKFFLSGKGGSKKVARKAQSRERKLERYMESDERVEKPRQSWGLKLDFGAPPDGGRAVLRVEDVGFAYPTKDEGRTTNDSLPSSLIIRHSSFDVDYGERIAIVGPNGAGKTTLLRLLAGQLQPQSGQVRLGANVRLGVMAQEQETLDLDQTVLEAVRRERAMSETEARSFLHFFLFAGDSVFRSVGACSLGERSRLQLARLVLGGCNLLLLDEPLNHLDIEGREHFEQALDAFEGTVIAVAHDRAFLRRFAARVIAVRDGTAQSFAGGYADYERTAAR